jgi:DNA polymerase-3 subunit beta
LADVEKGESNVTVSGSLFRDMVKKTIFSVSPDNPKPVLTGELIDISDGIMYVVAIDGFRISCAVEPFEGSVDKLRCIVPAHALNEIIKIIPIDEKDINIYITNRKIMFEFENCIVVSSLIEGDYVKFDQVFSTDFTTSLTVNREKLLKSVERVALMAGRDINKGPIKFNITENSIEITANAEIGTARDEIDVEQNGLPLEITFNPRYMIDVLKTIEEDEINLGFTTMFSPCIIKGVGNESRKYLVLPLRIRQ